MSKRSLKEPYRTLENQMIMTMMVALKPYGVDFPKSYSDMQACARALFQMFTIERRPLPFEIPLEDHFEIPPEDHFEIPPEDHFEIPPEDHHEE